MAKEYVFIFRGTKTDFLNRISSNKPDTNYWGTKYFYFHDYIVKIVDGVIHFGVERGGHSGGYWYIPIITERDEQIEFCGKIRYMGPNDDSGLLTRAVDKIWEFVLVILLLPFILLYKVYELTEWLVRKICKRPRPKLKTTEERLFDLMENHLGCVRK
jgi:hypothetical protein